MRATLTFYSLALSLLLGMVSQWTSAQSASFRNTFVVMSLNGGSNVYYDLNASTANPDFNQAHLGNFCPSAHSLVLKGMEHNVTKCNGCDITGSQMYYRVYPQGVSTPSFTSVNSNWTSDSWSGSCNNQRWQKLDLSVNLLNGLTPGTYVFEIYNQLSSSCAGTVYDSNNSANYRATFTVLNATYYRDADGDGFGDPQVTVTSCNGAPAGYVSNALDCNDQLITYVDADGDGYGSTQLAPCGVTNSSDCDDQNAQVFRMGWLYIDADGDGYTVGEALYTCVGSQAPVGYSFESLGFDCNDNAALVNPGMSEILYNGIDDNCDGNLDEGHQVTTRVITAQCGTTLSAVTTTIHVNSNSRATAYRFKVYNMATQEENIIERTSNYFGLADLPMGGTYGTTYRVSAELQYYGIWLGYYGEECYVSTPPHISDEQGSTTTCDTQLESITSIVHTYAGTNVEYYRFKFTHYDENNEEVVEIVDRERPWINFSTLETAKYGTTYMVEVATKLRSSANYSAYAAPCIIISPDVPAIESCGAQAATSNTTFLVQTAAQVRSWRFELTNMETFETMTIVRPIRYIRFVDMPNYQPGAEYGIRIAVMTNGNWSPYGPSCTVTAPLAAARQDIAATQFEVAAYPNTFDNDFRLKVTLPTHDRVEVRMFDMLGKQVDVRVLEAAEVEYAYFGKNIPAGVYNVVITQGKEVKTVRLIKK